MNGDIVILSNLTDPQRLSDEDLDQLRRDVLIEQERRANLAAIPEQIAMLAQTYRDGGGDEQALTDALTPEEQEAIQAPQPAAAEAFGHLAD